MPELEHVQTSRLHLDPVRPEDAPALFAIMSDPDGWWYDPANRHAELETTRRWCELAAARWISDGLSYWVARWRETGEVVGVGGAQRHRSGTWNISYRIAAAWQRQGLARELARAAVEAAGARDPGAAVIAWAAERNDPSRRTAEAVGLVNRGPRRDASDGQVRLAYSDRPLD